MLLSEVQYHECGISTMSCKWMPNGLLIRHNIVKGLFTGTFERNCLFLWVEEVLGYRGRSTMKYKLYNPTYSHLKPELNMGFSGIQDDHNEHRDL